MDVFYVRLMVEPVEFRLGFCLLMVVCYVLKDGLVLEASGVYLGSISVAEDPRRMFQLPTVCKALLKNLYYFPYATFICVEYSLPINT